MRYILYLLVIVNLYGISLKDGDIVFYKDSSIDSLMFDNLIYQLNGRYSHSYIYFDRELRSISLDFIGDKTVLDINNFDDINYSNILIMRYRNLDSDMLRCMKEMIESIEDRVIKNKIYFQYFDINDSKERYNCVSFITNLYYKCVDRDSIKSLSGIKFDEILFDKAFNKKYFDIIYKKDKD